MRRISSACWFRISRTSSSAVLDSQLFRDFLTNAIGENGGRLSLDHLIVDKTLADFRSHVTDKSRDSSIQFRSRGKGRVRSLMGGARTCQGSRAHHRGAKSKFWFITGAGGRENVEALPPSGPN